MEGSLHYYHEDDFEDISQYAFAYDPSDPDVCSRAEEDPRSGSPPVAVPQATWVGAGVRSASQPQAAGSCGSPPVGTALADNQPDPEALARNDRKPKDARTSPASQSTFGPPRTSAAAERRQHSGQRSGSKGAGKGWDRSRGYGKGGGQRTWSQRQYWNEGWSTQDWKRGRWG